MIIINAASLTKKIMDVIVQYYSLVKTINSNQSSVIISMFWLLLYYFLSIKRKLYIIFYLKQTVQSKIKRV